MFICALAAIQIYCNISYTNIVQILGILKEHYIDPLFSNNHMYTKIMVYTGMCPTVLLSFVTATANLLHSLPLSVTVCKTGCARCTEVILWGGPSV